MRIILRRVDIPADAKQGQASWLWDSVEKDIRETLEASQQAGRHAKSVLGSLKQKLMQAPGGLILLDGLDEVQAARSTPTAIVASYTGPGRVIARSYALYSYRPTVCLY